jgi:hypothetical protein
MSDDQLFSLLVILPVLFALFVMLPVLTFAILAVVGERKAIAKWWQSRPRWRDSQ